MVANPGTYKEPPAMSNAPLITSRRVTKREWMAEGGLASPRCWRRRKGVRWVYYIRSA